MTLLGITKGMLLSGTKGLLLLTNEEMQNARLEGRALGFKMKGFYPVLREWFQLTPREPKPFRSLEDHP